MKLADETLNVDFGFTEDLAIGETILSAVVTSAVYTGEDDNPSAMISDTASITDGVVSQLITGGVAGVIYELVCTVMTDTQVLQDAELLAVIDG